MTDLKLFIGPTTAKGRGVFTEHQIPKNTVLEVAPVIVMTHAERQLLDKTLLHDYIFEWQPGEELMCCMALGWVPIYNHASPSNCEYYMDYDDQTIMIKTVRKIKAGEELTINYNGDWDTVKSVWFEER